MATVMNLNLLPSEAKFQAAKIKLERKTRLAMVVMVVAWITSILAVYGADFFFSTRLNAEEKRLQKAQGEYMSLTDTVMVKQDLKYKAKMVGKTLAARFEYGKAFETINSIFPEGITLDNFDMDPGGYFKVSGSMTGRDNVDKLENLVQTINAGGDSRFVSVKLTNLSVKFGDWKVIMELTLK